MFLQIHTLTAYPAALLNRDDAGLAKRIPFGNAIRLRVSSQCSKRHWREDLTQQLPDLPDGLRTRSFFTRTVLPKAIEAGVDEAVAKALIEPLAKAVVDGGVKEGGDLNQPVLFGLREADYFAQMLSEVGAETDPAKVLAERLKTKEEKDNLKAMSKSAAGLTAALFGRMVTSDLLARVDAPVHVAHAFTVHAANTEMDYFTVVDDLNRDDETGAAHANQAELGAGVYYGYVAVDVPLLVSNLTGCEAAAWRDQDVSLARRVLEALIFSIIRQSPGAKKGSTAPYAWSDFLLLETGVGQPRSLANAFLEAVPWKGAQQDLRNLAMTRLANYLHKLDEMYGASNDGYYRGISTVLDPLPPSLPQKSPVPANIAAAIDALRA
ncbi:type I-E CRISPR-associated protein Cas7/Cse4/CasC [Castellaniella sp. S9]|uniref:type I-E CRISPR-associated protein Cas7/Cse4/CasC n=1 Tax=Castellaniella sp. S9 TaxID=2993652 RepID=UPI0022B42C45|nr:type I-E CRISPR-associated protein Cas7/Cse4/CasC [Castellaniella sp. S9]